MKRTIKICPRNAPLFGESPTKEQAEQWCKDSRDPNWCDGCERYEGEQVQRKKAAPQCEQLRLF